MSEIGDILEGQIRPFVTVTEDNKVTFKIQEGPIKEVGENGCQIDEMISVARDIIASFNTRFPCRENSCALTKLDEAMHWLDARKRDREKRQVEGINKP